MEAFITNEFTRIIAESVATQIAPAVLARLESLIVRAPEKPAPVAAITELLDVAEPTLAAWARRRGGVQHEPKGVGHRVYYPSEVEAWRKNGGMTKMVLDAASDVDWICPVCGKE